MKSICYIVPYFGKLPKNFQLWLNTCKTNDTINWVILTNDKTNYDYPSNVEVHYCEFEEIQRKMQNHYEFKIKIDSYWCLSLFKPAYGEIFEEYLKEYDFWGHCDVDLMWGDIRKFITDDILSKYEKIGFQGHSTLYKNNRIVNSRYKTIVPGKLNYIEVFSGKSKASFDETGMEDIYNYLNIPYFKEINFAHMSMTRYSFYLFFMPKEEDYKNNRQVFIWKNGKLLRKYVYKKKVYEEEYMYIHFFTRPMRFKASGKEEIKEYIIYPDVVKIIDKPIDIKYINKHGKCTKIEFYTKMLYYNRKKLSIKKIRKRINLIMKRKKQRKNEKREMKK